jgi:hypothetical protein
MYNRFIAPLCCIAAVAFACGPRPSSVLSASTTADAPVPAAPRTDATREPLASSLSVRVQDGVALALRVTNSSEKQLEINFPGGQTYEFRVVDAKGRELWRWSEGRMFTQSLQNRLLGAGETLTFEEQWKAHDAHGKFVAIATMLSDNHPVETRVEFVLP